MKYRVLNIMSQWVTGLMLLLLVGCAKDTQLEIKEPEITLQSVLPRTTEVILNWKVNYLAGYKISVQLSLNEDMSDAVEYAAFSEGWNGDHNYFYWDKSDIVVEITELNKATKYYYRLVVYNPGLKKMSEVRNFTTAAYPNPTGSINGVFSVSPSKKVYFSQGNLQYRASDGRWQFAEHQYDCIGGNNLNISSSYNNFIDLFGWGTSGWDSGARCYQPWSTSTTDSDYCGSDLTGIYAEADWGVYNAIDNGGNTVGQWRTLTKDEWKYLFQDRSDASLKYGHGKVNGKCGIILLPDIWVLPLGLGFTAGNSSWGNNYTVEQWTKMEANGAVFLPAAGGRGGTQWSGVVGKIGEYWSSIYDRSNTGYSYYVNFGGGYVTPQESSHRYYGKSVRLVCPAE